MSEIVKIRVITFFIFGLTGMDLCAQENNTGLERLMQGPYITDNNIRKILQDKQGFLWLSSQYGLLKYDGYAVTQYKHNPFDPRSLPQNKIYTLFFGHSDTMWLGTPEGLCIFDRKSEKFTRFTPAIVPGMPALGNVSAICEDGEGNLWIGNFEGKLWKYNRKTGKFLSLTSQLSYQRKPDLPQDYVPIIKIYKDSKGVIWIGTNNGLHRLNANGGKFGDISFTDFRHNASDSLSLRSSRIADIYEDKQGVLWISTSRPAGLTRFDAATEKFINYPDDPRFSSLIDINNFRGHEILEDADSTLWIADSYTLKSLKKGSKSFDYWLHKNSFKDTAIKETRILAIGLDVRGNIFVSTSNGLHSFNLNRKAFSLSQRNANDKNSISSNEVLAITEDKSGNIWIGTQNGGLNKWNKASGAITRYQFSATDAAGLKINNVAGITEDPEGNLWICNGQYLSCLKKGSQVFTHFNSKKTILSICRDREGLIWLGTTNGIKSFDPISAKFENDYPYKENDPTSISDYTAISIFADSRGNLWVGTGSIAFNRFDKTKKKFIYYKNNPLDTASISSNVVQTIFEDSKKNLWIGTSGGGLCQYNYSSDNFFTHTRQAELPWNTVYSILEDDSGYLWLGTEKGLSCYKPATKEFINYDAKDDLQNNLFVAYSDQLRGSAYKGSDGTLYFGGEQGLNYFNPSQIRPNKHIPPVFITQFKIFDKPQPEKNEARKILNYKQNFFSFEFTALNYTNPQKNKYAYQLEGFDTGWIYSGSRRYASYTNLDPGEYTFKVKGSNNDGIWNEEGVSIKVIIRPPWWKTWWAYIIYGLLVIAAALAVHRYQKQRVIQAEREKAHQKEMAQAKEIEKAYTELKLTQAQLIQSEKMASLGALTAGIAHEIQNPLNFVNNFSEVNSELIAEMKQEIAKANLATVEKIAADIDANEQKIIYHGKRADAIVKSMLQHSRSSSGKNEPTDINALADEYFRLAYHGLRAKDKSFVANFETDFDSSIEKIKVVQQDIGRCILNLVTNAFYAVLEKKKQSPEGYEPTVLVSTRKRNGKVEVAVKDNGNGIPQKIVDKIFQPFFTTKPTGQGTGLGLSLSYDIVKAHGGQITVETTEGEGTEFIIQLPG